MPSQRLQLVAEGTVSGGGTVTLVFQQVPQGLTWTGMLSIPSANLGSEWSYSLANGGIIIGSWLGRAPFGPVQALGTEQVTIHGVGATPGAKVQAVWVGVADASDAVPFVYPDPAFTSLSLQFLLADTIEAAHFIGGDFTGHLIGLADAATNADKLDGHDSTFFATAAQIVRRPQLIGTRSNLAGGDLPSLATQTYYQRGNDVVHCALGSGQFQFTYPAAFPNGVLGISFDNDDDSAFPGGHFALQIGLVSLSDCYGIAYNADGTVHSDADVRIGFDLLGW